MTTRTATATTEDAANLIAYDRPWGFLSHANEKFVFLSNYMTMWIESFGETNGYGTVETIKLSAPRPGNPALATVKFSSGHTHKFSF